jgi:hypothetical protein
MKAGPDLACRTWPVWRVPTEGLRSPQVWLLSGCLFRADLGCLMWTKWGPNMNAVWVVRSHVWRHICRDVTECVGSITTTLDCGAPHTELSPRASLLHLVKYGLALNHTAPPVTGRRQLDFCMTRADRPIRSSCGCGNWLFQRCGPEATWKLSIRLQLNAG